MFSLWAFGVLLSSCSGLHGQEALRDLTDRASGGSADECASMWRPTFSDGGRCPRASFVPLRGAYCPPTLCYLQGFPLPECLPLFAAMKQKRETDGHQVPGSRFPRIRFPAHRRRAPGARYHAQIHRRQSHSHHRGVQPRRPLSQGTGQAHGGPGPLRRQPERLRLRRDVERRIRPGDAGTGAGRQRRPFFRERAFVAGHVSHLRLRQR